MQMSGRFRRWRTTLIIILAIWPTTVLYRITISPFNKRSYDQRQWLAARPQDRAAMSVSALNLVVTSRMSTEEVRVALGPPDDIRSVFAGKGTLDQGFTVWVYYIGSWPLRAYDDSYLFIRIDKGGLVVGGEIGGS
jgi:hypothetical protein